MPRRSIIREILMLRLMHVQRISLGANVDEITFSPACEAVPDYTSFVRCYAKLLGLVLSAGFRAWFLLEDSLLTRVIKARELLFYFSFLVK